MKKLFALTVFSLFAALAVRIHAQNMQSVSCPYDGDMAMWAGSTGNAERGYTCTYQHRKLVNNQWVQHRFTAAC